MYAELKGKKALITGATKGIGKGISEKFASLGINSILNFSNDKIAAIETEKIVNKYGIDYHFLKADVSDPKEIRRLFSFASEKFGQLDIVVANAGIELIETTVLESTESDFDKVFDLNVKETFFVMQEAAKYLTNGGRLILISSTMSIHPDPGAAIYAASKAASKLFVDVLAKELGSRHINVNSVMPGIIDNAGVITNQPLEIKKQMMAGSPFNRLGAPKDVAKVVAFLASDEGSFVHGHHLQVNGGSIY